MRGLSVGEKIAGRAGSARNAGNRCRVGEAMKSPDEICSAIRACGGLPQEQRVDVFNAISAALGELVADVSPDPACSPRLLEAVKLEPNAYNPNRVAAPEMDLLENSMRADGITMPVVVFPAGPDRWGVVDGFHRRRVMVERLRRRWVPSSVIDKPLADRMASTIRHNRARGKHAVDLMAEIVKGLMREGCDDVQIAANLGMSPEELLRLKQMVGAARLMAGESYTRTWDK